FLHIDGGAGHAVDPLENVSNIAEDLAVGIAEPRDLPACARVRRRASSTQGTTDDDAVLWQVVEPTQRRRRSRVDPIEGANGCPNKSRILKANAVRRAMDRVSNH